MGFVGSMLGDSSGAGFKATGSPVLETTNDKQLTNAYKQANSGINQQQAFVNALAAQNGIQNQSSVYNQLAGVAAGTGPNPAQAMLSQATGANVANQAALMAGQRGAGGNVGLMARQAAQQGAGIQQNAAGQAAVMQANQQMNALNQMGGMANQQVGQQQQALMGYNQAAQGMQQNLLGAAGGMNNANVAMQGNINNANAGIAAQNAQSQSNLFGGLLSAAGTVVGGIYGGPMGAAAGGSLGGALGGQLDGMGEDNSSAQLGGSTMNAFSGGKVPGQAPIKGDSPKNDVVPATLSPGEIVIPRSILQSPDPVAAAAHFVHQTLKGGNKSAGNMAFGGQQASLQEILAAQGGAQMPAPMPGSEFQPQQVAAAPTPMTAAPAPVTPEAGMVGGIQSGFNQQQAGLRKEAAAAAMGAEAESKVAGEAVGELQRMQQEQSSQIADLDSERRRILADVADDKIDPNRYMANMSTGQKIANTIGLILSGVGSAITGQENLAARFIQKQIDSDIEAQKADMGKKQNLLAMNMQQYGNLKDAMAMTKANMLDITAMKMKQQAAAVQNPMAQAKLMQEAGKLEVEASQVLGPMRLKQEMLKQSNPDMDPTRLVTSLVPKEQQAKVLEEIEGAKNFTNVQKTILKSFDKVAKDNVILSKSSLPFMPEAPSRAEWRTLGISALKAAGSGSMSNQESELWDSFAKQKGDSDADVAAKRKGVINFLEQKKAGMGSTARAHGIDLSKFGTTSGDRFTAKEKEYLKWAEANPKDPKAIALKKKLGVE